MFLPQRSRSFLIISRIGSHGAVAFVWFPIQAPRERTASLSREMCMLMCMASLSSLFIFRVAMTSALYSLVPIGMISVFSELNLVPDTLHQWSRVSWTTLSLSDSLRNSVVLSANIAILGFCLAVGTLMPSMSGLFLILHANGSMARSNKGQDNGSPCRTPRWTWKGELSTPFMAMRVVAC